MVIRPMIKLKLPSYFTHQQFNIKLNNRVITTMSVESQQTIKRLTMLSLHVNFDESLERSYASHGSVTSDLYVEKDLHIYISNDGGRAYTVDSYDYFVEVQGTGKKILNVDIEISEGPTTYAEDIDYIDPVLMFYRKILPYDKYEVYGVFEKTLSSLGTIDRITYDTVSKEYRLYSRSGIIINYNVLPLVNPTKVNIEGTQYTNPPTAIWILDKYNIDDLIWMNKIEIHKIEIDPDLYGTFSDWIFDMNQQKIDINSVYISVKSINKRIYFDFEHFTYLNPNELIYSYSTDIISTIQFPFRTVYLKADKQYTLTELVINYSDKDKTYTSDLKLTGYFITDSKV